MSWSDYVSLEDLNFQEKRDRALFAKCKNVKWIYDNMPQYRKRIEREG
jgi:hypothetical protein|tara:strand:- start:864 stop:1007 length:144 start_codon:yes stop_codon:yes gene_type:complete